jgi:ribosome-interacting GTPase 1
MAKLKEELQRKPTIGKAEQAFYIKKEGTAQILLLGPPNTGKSTLSQNDQGFF